MFRNSSIFPYPAAHRSPFYTFFFHFSKVKLSLTTRQGRIGGMKLHVHSFWISMRVGECSILHPVVLRPSKDPGRPGGVWTIPRKEKPPCTCRDSNTGPSSLYPNHQTNYTVPAPPTSVRFIFVLYSHLCSGLLGCLFLSGFPTKIVFSFLFSSVRNTCLIHLIPLHSITRKILREEYKLQSSSFCIFSPVFSHSRSSSASHSRKPSA